MSQRALITIFSIGLVVAIGVSSLISSSITSSMIASAQLTGPAGADGADGVDGADGATGPQGEQGLPGADGAPGGSGAAGATGSGATGAQGPVGPVGPPGAPGPPGQDGSSVVPFTLSTGSLSTSISSGAGATVTGAGLAIPAGTYVISFAVTAMSVVPTVGGSSDTQAYCSLQPVSNLSAVTYASSPAADVTSSAILTLSGATTLYVACYVTDFIAGAVTANVDWSQLTIKATKLD